MGRWQPDAAGRLARAALDLYAERGYEQTTVADIAERAGVTERTFFRHFADKREVLFDGSAMLERRAAEAIAAQPPQAGPMAAAGAGLVAAGAALEGAREVAFVQRRALVVDANPSLRERELLKMAHLTAAVTAALVARGVPDVAAALAAQAAVAAFHTGFARWVAEPSSGTLVASIGAALDELRALAADA